MCGAATADYRRPWTHPEGYPLRIRTRAFFASAVAIALTWAMVAIAPVAATVAPKVVIIVGPTGAQTDSYRSSGDGIASAAEAAGANVVKVYSPNATYANVRAAVEGANVIVYLGHGNGFPNPYGYSGCPAGTTNQSCMLTDRDNGWGLNMVAGGGGGGDDESNMVYCGGDALRGTLSSSNSRYPYCQGAIHPAPGFVMIYSKACYTPGAGEGFDVKATESVAVQRVRNFSYPVLALGAGAYFATDLYQGASSLVQSIIENPNETFGDIAQSTPGYDAGAHRSFAHPDIPGAAIWVQQTADHGGDADYWYAYAGDPSRTPGGGSATPPTSDAVTYSPPIRLLFPAGTYTGYRFTDAGGVTGSRSYTLASGSSANTDASRTFPGQPGSWFHIVNGVWADYWIADSSGAYLPTPP
jgi:hypothetical protein